MFEVLIYLFETYVHSGSEISIDYKNLTSDLSDIGFRSKDIYKALHWLKNLSCCKKNIFSSINLSLNHTTNRIYTKKEEFKLNSDCRGFILFLEELEILTLNTREIIIERIMALDISHVNIEDLKWIVLIILFNIPGCEVVYRKLENLLFNFKKEIVH
ncbi:DUF494 family protein [Buchnera aphidicola]|uniref:Protein Smg n=1 Tax=Buchnera aphidicola subsp. Schizaphis graminum (strain Sg) TaxID=198804 RepID=SMG_BUCAP|nr:DUF494 family protein [Buchnera aphidicola]Q8K976.1 RecName: Full=Protein Smg [Buchnera aphidicola str. Sg (Schizaphis graminum)]AAM68019.1 Smg [Buchnera aphidicola str. Sg (Schizaphis graminum)]AWI49491.1 DUF494 domain-containing protein [Buchnera aphidicola (Schizaphis graminum)]